MKRRVVAALVLFILSIIGEGTSARAGMRMHGAGSTFVYPLFSKWFSEYGKARGAGTLINYQSIGSGGGIRQLIDGTVDFGATDVPMNEEQLKKAKREIHHFPVTLGAVAVTYRVEGLVGELKLTSGVIADIFLGKIKKWNDPALVALNAGMALPDRFITVVHRSDGSGTSAVFTEFLSKTHAEWKEKVGKGTAVEWPVGLGGKGNEGVTGLVKSLPDTIGYVELTFAISQKLPVAAIQNPEGQWIRPEMSAVTAALSTEIAQAPEDFRFTITAAKGARSYPISSMSFFLLDTRLEKAKWNESLDLIRWMIHEGQAYSEALHYAKLPENLQAKILKKLKLLEAIKK